MERSKRNLVIGITGKRRSGKSTVADYLPSYLTQYDNHYKFGIADEIKSSLATYTGGSVEDIEHNKVILRPVLQTWGDVIRERLLDILAAKILNTCKSPYLLIVPDVRLVSEAKFLRNNYNAVILTVERQLKDDRGMYLPNMDIATGVDCHVTEQEVNKIEFDYKIHNDHGVDFLFKTEINNFIYWLNTNR